MLREATDSLKTIVAKVKVWERVLKASDASKESSGHIPQAHANPLHEGHSTPTSPSANLAHRNFRSTSAASAASIEFDSRLGTPGVAENAEFLGGSSDEHPFTFHPDAPLDVHCPESSLGRVDVKLCWRHTDPLLIWKHREHLHYLIYGQARYVLLGSGERDIGTGVPISLCVPSGQCVQV